MDARGRRRRNWVIFWLVLVGLPILAYILFGLYLNLTDFFLDSAPTA
jgi:hypothetical protein